MSSPTETAADRNERSQGIMQILKGGALYFAPAFGVGFALGTIRVLWVVPRFGARAAELMEMPLMLVVIILAAGWVARRMALSPSPFIRLGVGCVALGLLLIAEFTLVLGLRGLTIGEYFASQDPVAGTAYVVMLMAFAVMPLLVARR